MANFNIEKYVKKGDDTYSFWSKLDKAHGVCMASNNPVFNSTKYGFSDVVDPIFGTGCAVWYREEKDRMEREQEKSFIKKFIQEEILPIFGDDLPLGIPA
jgi:hypothetical protein